MIHTNRGDLKPKETSQKVEEANEHCEHNRTNVEER